MLSTNSILYATDNDVRRNIDFRDCRATWRHLYHIANDATHPNRVTAKLSQQKLAELDGRRINTPMRAVIKAILTDMPTAQPYLTQPSLDAIMATEPLDEPFYLTDEPHGVSAAYVKMHVIL